MNQVFVSVSIELDGKHVISGNGVALPTPPIMPRPCFLMITGPVKTEGNEGVWSGRKDVKKLVLNYQGKSYPVGDCTIDVLKEEFTDDGIVDYRINILPKDNVEVPHYGQGF
ncbi:hypothetical protein CYY_000617 [Polysphondylium violaceum]|uniref:Uncharacterized protein n=1 Tax=Polysphondylium violaceum TaxID=133409 RepID=A0A8J4Q1G5_9MYCE|nr:hypothetical protein CYY_000617 [Polysphondylium violaceum]